jgi:hypothetical protein
VRGTWLLALLLGACTAGQSGRTVDAGAGSPPELGSTLTARVAGDSVQLDLHITNVTTAALRLELGSAQRFDFEVSGAGTAWRWSDDMAFAQVLGQEVLLPGESRRYAVVWPAGGRNGEYTATARLTSLNYPVELKTVFTVPADER